MASNASTNELNNDLKKLTETLSVKQILILSALENSLTVFINDNRIKIRVLEKAAAKLNTADNGNQLIVRITRLLKELAK